MFFGPVCMILSSKVLTFQKNNASYRHKTPEAATQKTVRHFFFYEENPASSYASSPLTETCMFLCAPLL